MSGAAETRAGFDARATKGWWKAHQWLLLRRASQLGLLALFVVGPLTGFWVVKGNLSSSLTLGVLPLTDPYVLLQSLAAGHWPATTALFGALIVVAWYALWGGRSYCSWVCPINLVTDFAAWTRQRIGVRGGAHLSRSTRYWILAMSLLVSAATGTLAWEWINPVTLLHRDMLFGVGLSWAVVLLVFLFDVFVMPRGWCGRLCPVGAFYSLVGIKSIVRVSAANRTACNDRADCYAVCPEPLVLKMPLKGEKAGVGPLILSPHCTNCGRCIDICAKDVFHFSNRFSHSSGTSGHTTAEKPIACHSATNAPHR